jgi:ABC-type multidrug transport system fused ATPase/permease subunit
LTEIGEKGINLSGGQKQRISLARAVYNDADVYLLDDPLSAVDSHVGKHIFDNVIGPKGILRGKTRILVTHKIAVLPHVDQILVMKDGRISESGTYSQLIRNQGSFAEFLTEFLTEGPEEIVEPEELEVIEEMAVHLERQLSRLSKRGSIRRKFSLRNSSSINEKDLEELKVKVEEENKKEKSKLISVEELKTGSVGAVVYCNYMKAIGIIGTLITITSYIAANSFTVGSSVWLSEWSNDANSNGSNSISSKERLEVYAALGLGQTIFILIATITLNLACLRGSSILHEQMLDNVIRSPMSFFDTTPIGLSKLY